jgi:hypothetical protein
MKENCYTLQINKYLSRQYEAIKRSCADVHIKNNGNRMLSRGSSLTDQSSIRRRCIKLHRRMLGANISRRRSLWSTGLSTKLNS